MFGATEPSARATEQVKQPMIVDRRHPKRLTNTPIAGPMNRNAPKVTELTHARKMTMQVLVNKGELGDCKTSVLWAVCS